VTTLRRLAALFTTLMLLSTAAFVIGVTIEKNQGHSESGIEQAHSGETGEASETHEQTEGETTGTETQSEMSETFAGVDVESTPIVLLGVVVSLALIGAALRWPRREVYAIAAVLCLGFALLDGSELANQLDENSGTVATFAALALVLHLGAAAVAALAAARSQPDRATPAAA
jgi:hypothetical protein